MTSFIKKFFANLQSSTPQIEIKSLTPAEASEMIKNGAYLVDVRESVETREIKYKVKNVIYAPMTEITKHLNKLPKDKTLIIACASGLRSSRVAKDLVKMGFVNVANLKGGLMSWQRNNFPTSK